MDKTNTVNTTMDRELEFTADRLGNMYLDVTNEHQGTSISTWLQGSHLKELFDTDRTAFVELPEVEGVIEDHFSLEIVLANGETRTIAQNGPKRLREIAAELLAAARYLEEEEKRPPTPEKIVKEAVKRIGGMYSNPDAERLVKELVGYGVKFPETAAKE